MSDKKKKSNGNKSKNKKVEKNNKRVFILLGILVVCIILAIIVLCVYFNDTKYDRLVKNVYNENKEDVDVATRKLSENEEFNNMSLEEQAKYMDSLLDYFENDEKIANVKYHPESGMFSFTYIDEDRNGRTGAYTLDKFESDTVLDVIAANTGEYKMKYLA